MPKSLKPRAGARPKGTPPKRAELPREVEEDIRRTARPQSQREVESRLARAIERLERDDPRGAVPEAEKATAMAPRSASGWRTTASAGGRTRSPSSRRTNGSRGVPTRTI